MIETAKSQLIRDHNGVYRENLDAIWYSEYLEDSLTGLWRVDIFKHDVPEWHSVDHPSLEEARDAAQNYYNQI